MGITKATVSAIAVLAVQVIVVLVIMSSNPDSWMQVILGIVTYLILLASTYLVSKEYYFKDYKINDPVREGLAIGAFISIILGVVLLSANELSYLSSNYMGFLYFAVALIPAITTIVAIDEITGKSTTSL